VARTHATAEREAIVPRLEAGDASSTFNRACMRLNLDDLNDLNL